MCAISCSGTKLTSPSHPQIPKFEFVSNAKPSLFAYQPATKPPTKETVEKVKTAVLSTTAKVTARAKAKEAEQGKTEAMETDDKAEEKPAESTDDAEMKVDDPTGEDKKKDQTKRKAPEPSSSRLENLSRVTPAQLQYVSFPSDSRYVPVRPVNSGSAPAPASLSSVTSSRSAPPVGFGGGILLMRDTKPGDAAEFHELEVLKAIDTAGAGAAATQAPGGEAAAGGDDADLLTGPIADPPAPFEWTDWGSD